MITPMKKIGLAVLAVMVFTVSCSSKNKEREAETTVKHVALQLKVPASFHFVVYGDTRFHDSSDTGASNGAVRRALVAAIDQENPAFISISGDIVYAGQDSKDWQVWDTETAVWREHKVMLYPALGNHDLKGNLQSALGNYFARYPEIQESRFYSVQIGNSVLLVLDSSLEELSGPQGEWLRAQVSGIAPGVDFVFLVFHHPCYTSSSDEKIFGGGHSARAKEQALAQFLEERQQHTRARFVVFNGHVHNYERQEHGGVTYFVTGGGGAHPYQIVRQPSDPYKDDGVNYHYLLAAVDHNRLTITMHKLEIKDGKEIWSEPDSVTITAPVAVPAAAD
jgi:acid phosphatase type 7